MTMTYRAFHGDAAVQRVVIERLKRHWSTGRVAPFTNIAYSEDGHCSAMGACIDSTDENEFVRQLGIPAGCGYLYDELLRHCGQHGIPESSFRSSPFVLADFAREYPSAWFLAIPLGADLGGLLPRFVAWLLHDLLDRDGDWAGQIDATVLAVGAQVSALYDDVIAGSSVTAAHWKAARHQATAVTDQAEHRFDRAVGQFIESVAWPPDSSSDELHNHVVRLWFALDDLLQRAHMNADDIAKQDAMHRLMDEMRAASQQPDFDRDAFFARPEFVAVMSPEGEKRRVEIQHASAPSTYPVARHHFEALLRLSQAA